MAGTSPHSAVDRPPLRGIRLVVEDGRPSRNAARGPARNHDREYRQPSAATGGVVEFLRRPDSAVLSEAIPFFFIGRNKRGLWIVREAERRTGGIFLFKTSALRFAQRASAPIGHATMVLRERFELDVDNRGNPFAAWLDAVLRAAAQLIPAYPPPIPIARNGFPGALDRFPGERR
jgi:hypothetical protein